MAESARRDDADAKRDDFEDRGKRAISANVTLTSGLHFPPASFELRRERFGVNRVLQQAGQQSRLMDFLLDSLQDDTSVLILAFATISVALGAVECQPAYFDPDPGLGNIGGDSCPLRPIWAGNAPIDLPMARDDQLPPDGPPYAAAVPCRAWAEGLAAFAAACLAALAKAASEHWRQGVLCRAVDWERGRARATVVRDGVERRIRLEDVQVRRERARMRRWARVRSGDRHRMCDRPQAGALPDLARASPRD
jgi:hypothetical protein